MAITAARGTELRAKGWRQEALLRLLENNLENGENPDELVVYGSIGKAARDWKSYDAIVAILKTIEEDETLIIQSGKPIGVIPTHKKAPIVIMANGNIVGHWATSAEFYKLYDQNLTMWGGLTAGDWQYIGSQGVIQGTYEIFKAIAREHFSGDLAGKFILSAGLGGMSGAQPLAGVLAGAAILVVEVDEEKADKRIATGFLQKKTTDLSQALAWIREAQAQKAAISVGLIGNAADIYTQLLDSGVIPDIVTDQTAAHDLLYGYVPSNIALSEIAQLRKEDPDFVIDSAGKAIAKEVAAILAFQKAGSIVFDNGNNIRTQAKAYGVDKAFDIPIFTEAFLRPLFERAIGPFRWVALSGDQADIQKIDQFLLKNFADNPIVTDWIRLAEKNVPVQGLPARICWLGHTERSRLAVAVNDMVANGEIGPVAFTRDHLDAGAMTHPNIMTENLQDGSDAISDWPLLNALVATSSQADLVAIHAGGGGYAGYMQSAGLTITADGTKAARERLLSAIDNDTRTGLLRYADAGYAGAKEEIAKHEVRRVDL
ncbi:urocanate hydratase [Pseudolactococcus insecticola]|uniref:Urocanate hydratase n=1 Tax=Pseudolactococcus insecticola TaxID=2709158 RepID=A0A6A0B6L2_9LACT|nr:urocanate hydratase [Lactococcus insecticola]GFH40385.1 urocanate hydratase [Lactococcus insecticola]